ncbi:MAG: hypothetical protein JNL10_00150 [Verrucomicrobiales bacterium]|nr:hypothetical protein [Verrucomicrobiales bacterium]
MKALVRTLPVVLALLAVPQRLGSEPVPVTVRLPDAPWNSEVVGSAAGPVWAGGHRYLFFVSDVPNLVENDFNGPGMDVFRRDTVTGRTELVTVSRIPGEGANRAIPEFSVSADGQRVAFVTHASNLVDGDTNEAADVFVRDMEAGTTTLVSWNLDRSGPGAGSSFNPVLSADGRKVVYGTPASDVRPGATPGIGFALCLRDVASGDVTVIGDWAYLYVVSAAADVVAYLSDDRPGSEPAGTATDIMVWRASTGLSERIRLPAVFGGGVNAIERVSILNVTPSGEFLAFYVPGTFGSNSQNTRGIWRADLRTGTVTSIWNPEMLVNPIAEDWLSISDDGRRLAFLINRDRDFLDGAIRCWTEGKGLQSLEELAPPGVGTTDVRRATSLQMSPDGGRVLFSTAEAVPEAGPMEPGTPRAFLRELESGVTRVIAVEERELDAAFDDSGSFLAYSPQENDGAGASLKVLDPTLPAPVEILSPVNVTAPVTSAATWARVVSLSDDGRRILYRSNARDLSPTPPSAGLDTYVYDALTGSNQLVNVAGTTPPATAYRARRSVMSADGSTVALLSPEAAVAGTTDYPVNVLVQVLGEGAPVLGSPKVDGVLGGVDSSAGLQLSGDGRRVLFRWNEVKSPPPIFSREEGRYLPSDWDAQIGELTPFSETALSSDGARIGVAGRVPTGWYDFEARRSQQAILFGSSFAYPIHTPSQGRRMVVGVLLFPGGPVDVYRIDPVVGQRELRISRTEYRLGNLLASGDGSTVVGSGRAVQAAGSVAASRQIFSVAMDSGVIELISVGVDGLPANGDCRSPRVSGDGRFVVFSSFASNLVDGDSNGFADIFVRDRYARVTHRLSRRDDGTQESGNCAGPAISGDGRTVAFTTFGTRLIPGDPSREPTVVKVSVPQSSVVDTDGDGLPDVWEQDHFGSRAEGAMGDPDGDGLTNLDEYRAHTSPVDELSGLEMAGLRETADGVEVDWYGHAGVRYQLESADSLAPGARWTPVGTPITGYEGLVHQRLQGLAPAEFLRVALAQP